MLKSHITVSYTPLTDMRKMLTKADIDHNAECFRRQMERFIEFGEDKAIMVNNADWLLDLNYIEPVSYTHLDVYKRQRSP